MHADDSDNESEDGRPVTPKEEDCCHSACDPCIFDVHKRLVEGYEKRKRENTTLRRGKNILCPSSYRKFVVSHVAEIAENYILIYLKYQEKELKEGARILVQPGQYVMLHAQGITRPFTPISWSKRSISFLAKLYLNGQFSTLLRNMRMGDELSIRGPYGDFTYIRNSFGYVVMFSMGSGIAVHYPIAKAIAGDDFEETRVRLIGGFHKVTDIPLRMELKALSDYWNINCVLHISQPFDESAHLHGIEIRCGRLNEKAVTEILQDSPPQCTLVLICGTEAYNQSVEEWVARRGYSNIKVFK